MVNATEIIESDSIGIVGAGLVGSLLSCYLSKDGYKSSVYEWRDDMRKRKPGVGRSINLAISARGLNALNGIGLQDAVKDFCIPMEGRVMHSRAGELSFQPYGVKAEDGIFSVSRNQLNKVLMDSAEASGLVKFEFNKRIETDPDLTTLSVTGGVEGDQMDGVTGEMPKYTHQTRHSMVFATDGAGSVIRSEMMNKEGSACEITKPDFAYKELTIPPGPDGTYIIEKHALHIWPRGSYMIIALPNMDGSFTCTLFMPMFGEKSFDALKTGEDVLAFFKEDFADLMALIGEKDLVESFFKNRMGQMVSIKCEPWSFEDKVLLMGDSAHSIVPFFGQGMNAGFEDVITFAEMYRKAIKDAAAIAADGAVTKAATDVSTVFNTAFLENYWLARKPQTDAIADMAFENYIEMREKVGDPVFLMKKAVESQLLKRFPGKYASRYSLVTFSTSPYAAALAAGNMGNEILEELCHGITNVEEVNWELAEQLVTTKFLPVMEMCA
jgi:kynurenine 3-monooxygenase